jgi:ribose transport system substrate-binding protein
MQTLHKAHGSGAETHATFRVGRSRKISIRRWPRLQCLSYRGKNLIAQSTVGCSAWITSLAFTVLLLATACKRQSPPTIAFIPQTTADDVWEPAHMGALDEAKQTEYRIYWNGPTSEDDIHTQISLLDRAIDRNDAGIILAPDQALALMMPVQKAVLRNIPTVVVGSPLRLPATGKLFYVLNDEDVEGKIAARRIGQQIHGKGTIAVLGLNPDMAGLILRMHSFEITLGREFPHITIVARHMGAYNEEQAEQSARDTLTSNPHLNAIFALTRTATTGAFHALKDSGRSKYVMLIGCDQKYQLLYYLSQGEIDSIIAENTYEMGHQAVRMIIAERMGRLVPNLVQIRPVLITRENMYSRDYTDLLIHDGRN